jgi:acetamidase/formamidase
VIGQWREPEGEAAFSLREGGIARRDLMRAGTSIGSGAVAPGWLTSPQVTAAATLPGRESPVLQPGAGKVEGRYLRATPETVHWGSLPGGASVPAATVDSGAVVTLDTVSHEGILDDQGRDPVAYFGRHGIPRAKVLGDTIALAASALEPDGPCVVTGPVAVRGAQPGDILRVDVLGLVPRVPYGVVSDRHAKGTSHDVSTFTPVERVDAGYRIQLRPGLPLDPAMGIIGVAGESVTAGDGLGVGSSLFLPVLVPGAKFFAGDPHYAREGGVALEAPLRATFRLTVLSRGAARPAADAADYWLPRGPVDASSAQALRESLAYLGDEHALSRSEAYAYLSAAARYLL